MASSCACSVDTNPAKATMLRDITKLNTFLISQQLVMSVIKSIKILCIEIITGDRHTELPRQ